MSVEHHTLSGKAKEVNIFLAALLNFTSYSVPFLVPAQPVTLALRYSWASIWIKNISDHRRKILGFNTLPSCDLASSR